MSTIERLQDLKVAGGAFLMTLGVSLSEIIDLIPDNIGKLGVVFSIFLSSVVIYAQYRNAKKVTLETEIMKRKELERQQGIERRKDYE